MVSVRLSKEALSQVSCAEEASALTKRPCHPLLQPLLPVVRALGAALGPDWEVVLHDVSGGDHAIVALENGGLTGRGEDAPLTDFGAYLLRTQGDTDLETLANYASAAPDGRPLRSSVALIRDDQRRIVGFLCLNHDTTRARLVREWAEALTRTEPLPEGCGSPERFAARKEDLLEGMLEEVRGLFGKPLRYLDRGERMNLLARLEDRGFFAFKGAVDLLARETGKSRFTLYGCLRELRRGKES